MGRYVVIGAGAVGGTIAGLLAASGRETAAIARGAHLDAIRAGGLELHSPDGTRVVDLPVAGSPEELEWRADDVVVIATKTQDTAAVLDALAAAAPPSIAVVCAQNGVENERIALRRFPSVHGMCVMLPASHLEPGVVVAHGAPAPGILDVGRYPTGADEVDETLAADLRGAGFSSEAQPRIMRWKYAKLRMNLANSIEAACGRAARGSDVFDRARAEADACFAAAGLDVASEAEDRERRGDIMRIAPVAGQERGGGSSWQSLARGSGSIETDYLNGEIVLLGRQYGVPTPVNAALQRVARAMARDHRPPASMDIAELEAEIASTVQA